MITLIFMDCECEYDNRVIIFFETLRNHVEDFGYSTKIDLKGIEIKKDEFDNILNACEKMARKNKVTNIKTNERQRVIEKYLGTYFTQLTRNELHEYRGEFVNSGCLLSRYCAKKGYTELIQYIRKYGHNIGDEECKYAAYYGNLECLKYVHNNGCILNDDICLAAASGGQLECLKYLHNNGCVLRHNMCVEATVSGNLECLKYVYENSHQQPDNYLCCIAAIHEHIGCLKYLHEKGCPMNVCDIAAQNGDLECLKYSYENRGKWNDECHNAALNGHVECLKYAYENGCPIDAVMCKKEITEKLTWPSLKKCKRHPLEECKKYLNSIIKLSL